MDDSSQTRLAASLSTVDVVALTVGVVIGASVFETPALVAGNTGSSWSMLLAWALGGGVSIVGALCYAELTTAYPHAGGDYFYFQRAFGDWLAFLFAWARLVVIQTGSIALLAFVFGDYATELWPIAAQYSPSIYAALAVAGLTLLNALGVRQGKHVQRGLTIATVIGLFVIIGAGLFLVPESAAQAADPGSSGDGAGSFGMAMVFVLLTYGGWNEAAYLSAEVRDLRRNMTRGLFASLGLIAGLYLLVNWAYLQGLGLAGMAGSEVIAADLMRAAFGPPGAKVISLLVVAAALSSTNATIFTGARTSFALGQDVRFFRFLGRWDEDAETPANALLVQGAIALGLVGVGAWTRQGFEAMVDYTAPVFWLFFGLAGAALFVLRRTEPGRKRPFRVPLYPAVPLLFCAACLYMFWSSVAYAGMGALLGVGVLVTGVPLLALRTTRSLDASS
ncbi:APC family permease [Salinibacter grassmerensis]|uniref:APC family permease n=1 Tax=Salinibacter grassmerensis TaxID=3040353 RepID=UPI0021E807C1|nr:amino acid permease [Salinibacter grassmerensis]